MAFLEHAYMFSHLPLYPLSFWFHFLTYDCFLMGARTTSGTHRKHPCRCLSTMIGRKFCLDEIDYFNTSDDKVDAIETIVTKYWTRIFWQIRSNYIFRPFLFLPFLFAPVRFFVRFFEIVFSVRLSSFECFRCQWTSIYFVLWWIHFFRCCETSPSSISWEAFV